MFGVCKRQLLGQVLICRHLNIWSPLATAFDTVPKKKSLFNFHKQTGLFNIPELKTADGWAELVSRAISEAEDLITETSSVNRKRKVIDVMDDLSNALCKVADMAEFIRLAHPNPEFQDAATEATISLSGLVEKLNTNRELFNTLDHSLQHGDIEKLSPTDTYVANLLLDDFKRSGVHLPEDERQKVVDLTNYTSHISREFHAMSTKLRQFEPSDVPNEMSHHFIKEDGKLVPRMDHRTFGEIGREIHYKLWNAPNAQQEHLLRELLNTRHELAQLCGFPTFAHRALKGSTIETPDEVKNFLNILNGELKHRVSEEYEEMQRMKNEKTRDQKDLMLWDVSYLYQQAQMNWYNSTNHHFEPYLSLGTCMDGLNMLTQALYGITLESVPTLSGEVWADNIKKLAVIHEDEGTLGYIYCDFFERPEKHINDCHFCIKGGKLLSDGSYQNPIVVVVLSLPPPDSMTPCLLNLSTIDSLFHEMGHALHSMLGRTKHQHVTGTRCTVDFAEVPSTFMENFSSDPRVISKFAKHYQTQEPIPQSLLDVLYLVKNGFPGINMESVVLHSMLDQVYHSGRIERSTTEILKEVYAQYSSLPYVENTAPQLRFSHLTGYGAKYYSYLVSRAITVWIWRKYFESDPFSRSAGEKFRHECLLHGASKPSSQIVSDFLNQKVNAPNLAKVLIDELDFRREYRQSMKRLINTQF